MQHQYQYGCHLHITKGFLLSMPVAFVQNIIETLADRSILRPRKVWLSRLLFGMARIYSPVSLQLYMLSRLNCHNHSLISVRRSCTDSRLTDPLSPCPVHSLIIRVLLNLEHQPALNKHSFGSFPGRKRGRIAVQITKASALKFFSATLIPIYCKQIVSIR